MRDRVLTCLVLVCLCTTPAFPPSPAVGLAAPAIRSNIIVVMADDLDVHTMNRAISRGYMPNLVRYIISRGVSFSNAFVTYPVCCPSRATFLTGQYAHNHNVKSNLSPSGGVTKLDDSSTIGTWLRDAGYRTGYVGRYLNEYGRSDVNRDSLLDVNDIKYVPPGWDDWQALFEPSTSWMYNFAINDNGVFAVHGSTANDYQTDVLASRSADFINESDVLNDSQPFFLVVMPSAPHIEVGPDLVSESFASVWEWTLRVAPRHIGTIADALFQAPSFNEQDVSDKPAWLRQRPMLTTTDTNNAGSKYRARLGSLRAIDDLIGTLASTLEATGELEETVFLFTSDNGYHYGEHRLAEKLDAYEESIRVPLTMFIPGVAGGRVLRQFITNNDLAPTLLELAGAQAGITTDGRSFVPLFSAPEQPWRKRFLVEQWWELGRGTPNHETYWKIPDYAGVRTSASTRYVPSQMYVEYADTDASVEFYDLQIDPHQLSSLHADPSPTRALQRSIHSQWLAALKACHGESCRALEFFDR